MESESGQRQPVAQPKKSLWQQAWSWVVVGAIIFFLLGGGLTFMTSSHPLIADAFYLASGALFTVKFLTWEDARQQERNRRRLICAFVIIAAIIVVTGAVEMNHWINKGVPTTAANDITAESKAIPAPPIVRGATRSPVRVDWRNKQNWRQNLHTGMTRTEVRYLFGEPKEMSVVFNTEFWEYGLGQVHFDMDGHPDGSLSLWSEP